MNIILPLTKEAGAVSDVTLGFQPLNNAWSMTGLADRLGEPTADPNAVLPNAGETAIPDVCAHVQYLRTKLRENPLNMADEAVKAWMGVLAMIALSERRSERRKDAFKLTVKPINLTAGTNEFLKSVYCDALQAEHLLDANNNIRVLYQSGNPVAVLDPVLAQKGGRCFCYPFSTITNNNHEMDQVKWFVAGGIDQITCKPIAHRWQNVCGDDVEDGSHYLDEGDKAAFAEFLCALKAQSGYGSQISFVDCPKAVDAVLNALGTDVVDQAGNLVTVQQTMQSAYAVRPQNLLAWRGVLACVALSKLRGYEIELEEYKPRIAPPADDLVRYVLTQHEKQPSFTLIKVNGARVGRVDSDLLIRPLCYQEDPLPLVPWFDDNTHLWIDLADDAAVPKENVSLAERKRLTSWYAGLAQAPGMPHATELQTCANHLQAKFGQGVPGINNPVPALTSGSFPNGTPVSPAVMNTLGKFSGVPDLAVSLPADTEIFTERLVLTMEQAFNAQSVLGIPRAGINNTVKLIYDPILGAQKRFTALMPLKESFTQLLSQEAELELMSISMQQNSVQDTVEVSMVLNDGGMILNKKWSYSLPQGEVLYYDTFPYLAMWPYVNTDSWKKYQVVCSRNLGYSANPLDKPFLTPCDAELKPMHPADDCGTSDGSEQWKVMEYDRFPEYIHFVLDEAGSTIEVGSVYVAPPKSKTIGGKSCYAIIDFGSSNTIVRLADSAGNRIPGVGGAPDYNVFTNNYVKPLTRFVSNADFYKDNFYTPVREFHEFYWLYYCGKADSGADFWVADQSKSTDRLPTVAEVYHGANDTHDEAPRYGQFLRSDCNVMSRFMADAAAKGYTSIEALGIRSNLKMGSQVESPENKCAGEIAMQMILLECALAAIEREAQLVPVLSYPDDIIWKGLKTYWVKAIAQAHDTCESIIVNQNILRTTELWSANFFASQFVGNVDKQVGYCIVDIGGGTTDVSLWKAASTVASAVLQGGMSVKYAGRQILSETLFSFYRRLSGATPPNVNGFDRLWSTAVLVPKTSGDIVKHKYLEEMKRGFGNYCAMDLSIKSNLAEVQKGVPLLSDTIVSNCDFSMAVTAGGTPEVQPFLALLRLKILNVFYVVARFLELTEAYDETASANYSFSLAGNGAAALDVAAVDTFIQEMMKKIVCDRPYGISHASGYRKTEVVNGLCELIRTKYAEGTGVNRNALKPPAGAASVPMPRSEWDDVRPEAWNALPGAVKESYNEYVEEILNPAKGLAPGPDYLSVDGATTIYDMLTLKKRENQELFDSYCTNILNQVLNESSSDTSLDMVEHIAAIKIIDKMLLVDKYK